MNENPLDQKIQIPFWQRSNLCSKSLLVGFVVIFVGGLFLYGYYQTSSGTEALLIQDEISLYKELLASERIGPRGNTIVYRTLPPVEGVRVDFNSKIVIVDADTKNIRKAFLFSELIDPEEFGLPVFLYLSEDGEKLFFTEGFYEGYNEKSPLYVISTNSPNPVPEPTLLEGVHINLHDNHERLIGGLVDKVVFVDSNDSSIESCGDIGENRFTKNRIRILDLSDLTVKTILEGNALTNFKISERTPYTQLEYIEEEVFLLRKDDIQVHAAIEPRAYNNQDLLSEHKKENLCWAGVTNDHGYTRGETPTAKTMTIYTLDRERNLLIPQF